MDLTNRKTKRKLAELSVLYNNVQETAKNAGNNLTQIMQKDIPGYRYVNMPLENNSIRPQIIALLTKVENGQSHMVMLLSFTIDSSWRVEQAEMCILHI